MKKTTKLAVAAFCAIGAVGMFGGDSFADSSQYIKLIAKDVSQSCYFWKSDGSDKICNSSVGQYDAATKTLTLKSVSYDEYTHLDIIALDAVTVVLGSTDSVSLDHIYASSSSLILNLGQGHELSLSGQSSFKNLTIQSGNVKSGGTLNIGGDTFRIDGGSINLAVGNGISGSGAETKMIMNAGEIVASTIQVSSLTMKGGKISVDDSISTNLMIIDGGNVVSTEIRSFGSDSNMTVNGGNISVPGGIVNFSNFTMNGGNMNVKSNTFNDGSAIHADLFTINGGNLNIDNFEWGINSNGGQIIFNGGVTSITNAGFNSVRIFNAKDAKNDIVFGKGMGIKERGVNVWYLNGGAGIYAPKVTILSGGHVYEKTEGYGAGSGSGYDWTWLIEWSNDEEWDDEKYDTMQGYIMCLNDGKSFEIINKKGYLAANGLSENASDNLKLSDEQSRRMKSCKEEYFGEGGSGTVGDDENKGKDKGLIIEGSGEEKKSDKKDNKDKTVPGAPNTGLFGDNKAFAVAAAVIVVPVLGIAGYLAIAAKKRADRKVSFKKR